MRVSTAWSPSAARSSRFPPQEEGEGEEAGQSWRRWERRWWRPGAEAVQAVQLVAASTTCLPSRMCAPDLRHTSGTVTVSSHCPPPPHTHTHIVIHTSACSQVLLRRGGVVCEAEALDGLIKGGPSPHPPSCLQGVRK